MLIYVLWVVCVVRCGGVDDSFESLLDPLRRNVKKNEINLNQSFFMNLENYHANARHVTQQDYPWIARVVHSKTEVQPHMCTAICIDERIFITAARCIYSLVVTYTTVIFAQKRLTAMAFVVPTHPTKQQYDDIGFIVVKRTSFQGIWSTIELFGKTNRTDNAFKWFSKIETRSGVDYKVVGYAAIKGHHKIKAPDRRFYLTELNVVVGMDICPKILTRHSGMEAFVVPCYHSCSVEDFMKTHKTCLNYHGVEGGAVYDTKTNKLVGVATWGSYFPKYELPVGFSVANSLNFFKDYTCAKRIRDDTTLKVFKGYYQKLCVGL